MEGAKRFVIAGIDLDDAVGMGLQLLDVNARAEAATLGTDHDDAHRVVTVETVDLLGQAAPADGVQRVDGRAFDDEFGDAVLDRGPELASHDGLRLAAVFGLVCAPANSARASMRSLASRIMRPISASHDSSLSITAATWPLGRSP